MSWSPPPPNWDAVAGRVLDGLFSAIREEMPGYSDSVTVFGSAAIQLCYDEHFTSADVDLMVLSGGDDLRELAGRLGLGRSGSVRAAYGLQICPPQLFRPTPHYMQRAHLEKRHGVNVVVPHVRDILVAKLHRFREEGLRGIAAKDRKAFLRVRELSGGHPTDHEMIEDLRLCEPDLRVPDDGSVNAFRLNVLDLFSELFGRRIDLETEILGPGRESARIRPDHHGSDPGGLLSGLEPTRD
jgi:hypothetical protein